tara:strand:- start:5698 stop:6555 length:858 start_codon:yes stop_codon:yes gene_type:complete
MTPIIRTKKSNPRVKELYFKCCNTGIVTPYTKLINSIDANLVTFKELVDNKYDKKSRNFCIRHDVDDDMIVKAVELARLENYHNIKSTYFIKYDSDYFDFSDRLVTHLKAIARNGHDLALHADVVGLYLKLNKSISMKDILKVPLDFLRTNGLEILGSAAHGNPENYSTAHNYEFFKEFEMSKNEGVGQVSFNDRPSLSDVGLEYETYLSLKYDTYICDSMGTFSGVHLSSYNIIPYENSVILDDQDRNVRLKAIDEFNILDSGVLQLLTHPSKLWDENEMKPGI